MQLFHILSVTPDFSTLCLVKVEFSNPQKIIMYKVDSLDMQVHVQYTMCAI